jgi:hypothetical protein
MNCRRERNQRKHAEHSTQPSDLCNFIETSPFPKAFLLESEFITTGEGCVMRERDVKTEEIKSMQIVAGKTKIEDVWKHCSC